MSNCNHPEEITAWSNDQTLISTDISYLGSASTSFADVLTTIRTMVTNTRAMYLNAAKDSLLETLGTFNNPLSLEISNTITSYSAQSTLADSEISSLDSAHEICKLKDD